MRSKRILVKLGGASLNQENTLLELAKLCAIAKTEGHELILVHGGGPAINAELTLRGIKWAFIDGQRQTTPEMAVVIEQVLFGKVNLEVSQTLQQSGLNVKRFSGSQDKIFHCIPENPLLIQVGKIMDIDTASIEDALSDDCIPVIAPLGFSLDGRGALSVFNINADWAAVKLAAALDATEIYFLTDQVGILDDSKEHIKKMTPEEAQFLIQNGIINGGMMTKVRSMLFAIENGVENAKIGSAHNASDLFIGKVSGSTITPKMTSSATYSTNFASGGAYGTLV